MEEVFLKCTLENDTYNCIVLNQGEELSLKAIIKNSKNQKKYFILMYLMENILLIFI